MNQCNFIKPDKTKCKAKAVQDDGFCFWHSAKMKEKREQAIRDGGNSPKRSYGRDEIVTITNTQDVLKLIEETINDLRGNKTSTKLATAIGYLSGIALKTIEQGDIEKRLEVIEYAIKLKKQTK